MSFSRMWRIEGILTTKTPLHIGDGFTTHHCKIKEGDKPEDKCVDITSVVKDVNGRAYLPGTSIKGDIRAWIKSRGCPAYDIFEQIFGSEDTKKKEAMGGKAEFWNAYALPLEEQNISYCGSYWRPERLTDVTVSVALDRRKKTAIDQKLFYYEFVPPGIKFKVTITVPFASMNEIALLLYALEYGFSDDNPIVIGASTGDDWGRLGWKLENISKIDAEDVKKWINDNSMGKKCDFVSIKEKEEFQNLKDEASKLACPAKNGTDRINVKLKFKGPFLVNDPGEVKQINKDETDENKKIDHIPRRNHDKKIILPAKSFRGAFRSQAERIIRTLGGRACCPSDPCKPDKSDKPDKKPCLACQIFGSTGQKSLISFTDFVQCDTENPEIKRQEFIAIDRFTGGGAKSLKFNAEAVIDPELKGTISIDKSKIENWGKGLLALTIRDLMEGDITFGFGSAKGYGKCEAEMDFLVEKNRKDINTCVNEFREKVKKEGANNG